MLLDDEKVESSTESAALEQRTLELQEIFPNISIITTGKLSYRYPLLLHEDISKVKSSLIRMKEDFANNTGDWIESVQVNTLPFVTIASAYLHNSSFSVIPIAEKISRLATTQSTTAAYLSKYPTFLNESYTDNLLNLYDFLVPANYKLSIKRANSLIIHIASEGILRDVDVPTAMVNVTSFMATVCGINNVSAGELSYIYYRCPQILSYEQYHNHTLRDRFHQLQSRFPLLNITKTIYQAPAIIFLSDQEIAMKIEVSLHTENCSSPHLKCYCFFYRN